MIPPNIREITIDIETNSPHPLTKELYLSGDDVCSRNEMMLFVVTGSDIGVRPAGIGPVPDTSVPVRDATVPGTSLNAISPTYQKICASASPSVIPPSMEEIIYYSHPTLLPILNNISSLPWAPII